MGERLGLTNDSGQARTVGVSLSGKTITVALSSDRSSQLTAVRLPVDFNPFTGQALDGSRWGGSVWGPVPADFPSWPWQWSFKWVSPQLEYLFARMLLPTEGSPGQAERRWALARLLLGQDGNALHKPLDPVQVGARAVELLSVANAEFLRLGHKQLHVARDEVTALIAAIDSGAALAEDGLIHRPYPAPDVTYGVGNHVSGLYSKEALRILVEQVYMNALLIYEEIVDAWFPKLKPTLGLACLLPAVLQGALVQDNDPAYSGPSFVFETAPLPAGEPTRVDVRWVEPDEPVGISWSMDIEARERLRNLIRALRPGLASWAYPYASYTGLSVYGDMPATAQAYQWLGEDLKRLKVVGQMPSVWDY